MFFMLPNEVHNRTTRLNIRNSLSEDDCASMLQDAYTLKSQEKVVHVQPYTKGSPVKQPFLMIIENKWMLEMCILFSSNNSWAIDSIFKINKSGLRLYTAVAPFDMLVSHYGTCFVARIVGQNMNK